MVMASAIMTAPFSPRIRDVQHGFPNLNRWIADRKFRQQCRIEAAHQNAINNAAMDRRMIENDNRFPSNWPADEKQDAIARLEGKV